MENYIREYFTNPDNVASEYVLNQNSYEMETPELFFEGLETEQSNASIVFEHIECKDGFKMSVQASIGHYCNPRITLYNKNNLIYTHMEVGYPSEHELLLESYDEENGAIFPYVPVEVLNKIIEKHGGLKI